MSERNRYRYRNNAENGITSTITCRKIDPTTQKSGALQSRTTLSDKKIITKASVPDTNIKGITGYGVDFSISREDR
jgi:hypothetical protein